MTMAALTSLWLAGFAAEKPVPMEFHAGALRITLDASGRVASLYDKLGKRELLPPGRGVGLLGLIMEGRRMDPVVAEYEKDTGTLRLSYGEGLAVTVRVKERPTHATFRLVGVDGARPDRVDWGPLWTTITKTVGETVGVVRDDRFAVGIQALNIQTVGAATAAEGGSYVLAWAIEREGGIRDSAIAIFGCATDQALMTIGKIEVDEGLPHPVLGGKWAKISPEATQPYLIAGFGEANIDDCIALAKELEFKVVYHPGPFQTWGHFKLRPGEFPDGDESLRRCAEKARRAGIGLGVHTLTAFITPNDPYVTPVPDPRLAKLGTARLAEPVNEAAMEIAVDDIAPFTKTQMWGWDRKFAVLGTEIVEYRGVDEGARKLTGCVRGMFGTKAAAHEAGAEIGRLATHNYGTFYPGIEGGMIEEMTARIVELFRKCGLVQISFDGLEGLADYGYSGDWTRCLFVKQCWDGWQRPDIISDASNLLHYLWHIHTRMNWGEPWGKALREGMPEVRFRNQDYFDRNLFPHMLGWFEFRTASGELEATSLDEIEWMLSKAAGFNAGFAIVAQPENFCINGQGKAAIAAIREWERARRAGAFSAAQRERLKAADSDWHLEPAGKGKWRLWPVAFSKTMVWEASRTEGGGQGEAAKAGRANGSGQTEAGQAGARGHAARWQVDNKFQAQPLRFVLRCVPGEGLGAIEDPSFGVGNREVVFRVRLEPGQYLVCEGEPRATVCDANWNAVREVAAEGKQPLLATGQNGVLFSARPATAAARTHVRLKTLGDPEIVGR